MDHPPLAAALAALAAPLAASIGLELWGIELAFAGRGGGRGLVRVFVENAAPASAEDSPGAEIVPEVTPEPASSAAPYVMPEVGPGVGVDQCAELSRLLALGLDVENIIPGPYVLEVSSPGLERVFFTASQLAGAVGREVEITLRQPRDAWPGRRKFRGLLVGAPKVAVPGDRASKVAVPGDRAPQGEEGERPALFTLRAEDPARPDAGASILSFAFDEVKRAAQVHVFPEQVPPGKKKSGRKNSARASEKDGGAAGKKGETRNPSMTGGNSHESGT